MNQINQEINTLESAIKNCLEDHSVMAKDAIVEFAAGLLLDKVNLRYLCIFLKNIKSKGIKNQTIPICETRINDKYTITLKEKIEAEGIIPTELIIKMIVKDLTQKIDKEFVLLALKKYHNNKKTV